MSSTLDEQQGQSMIAAAEEINRTAGQPKPSEQRLIKPPFPGRAEAKDHRFYTRKELEMGKLPEPEPNVRMKSVDDPTMEQLINRLTHRERTMLRRTLFCLPPFPVTSWAEYEDDYRDFLTQNIAAEAGKLDVKEINDWLAANTLGIYTQQEWTNELADRRAIRHVMVYRASRGVLPLEFSHQRRVI